MVRGRGMQGYVEWCNGGAPGESPMGFGRRQNPILAARRNFGNGKGGR